MHKNANLLSIVTPAFNEEQNLPALYVALKDVLSTIDMDWEWIIVDDHSSDSTFATASSIAKTDKRVRVFRFSRNFGSHLAIKCGLSHARGICAAALAADLQDPPIFLKNLLASWREGAHTVWAVRDTREGESFGTKLFSRLYYLILRKVVGLKEVPASGADFFLIDRKVINVFLQYEERHISIFTLLAGLGFKQVYLTYDKRPRNSGQSGWTLAKKIKLVIDSIVSHSYTPIRAFSIVGFLISCIGFIYALVILTNRLLGITALQGWASLMVVILIIGGLQMLMLGVLGEYLWRTLEQSRKRPDYLIEAQTDNELC